MRRTTYHCKNLTFTETQIALLRDRKYNHVELDTVRFNEHYFNEMCSMLTPMTSLTSIVISGTVPLSITQGERFVRLLIENGSIDYVCITAFREYTEPYDPSQDPLVKCLEENKAAFTSLSIANTVFTCDMSLAIIRSLKNNGTLKQLGITCYSLPHTHVRDLSEVLNVNSTLTHFNSVTANPTLRDLIDAKLTLNITQPTLAGRIEKMRLDNNTSKHTLPLIASESKRQRKQ